MRYAMVIVKSDTGWEALNDADSDFYSIVHWWTELKERGNVMAGAELAAPRTATSISWPGAAPIVTKSTHFAPAESIGGFLVLSVDSADEAMEIARSWPAKAGIRIEVRQVVGNW